jgi:prepilin-type N-terminal cleavage/methylation domain-containing protein
MTALVRSGRGRERGYNLIEVLIATALLAMVLLSIISLFYLGQRTVYSGKQMTKAVAVASRIAEDLQGKTHDDLYGAAGFNVTNDALGTVTILGTTYTNCTTRDTGNISATTDPAGMLQTWADKMTAAEFANGKVTLVFRPIEDVVAPSAEVANPATTTDPTSQVLLVRAIIEWTESLRPRHLIIDTVKTVRRRV